MSFGIATIPLHRMYPISRRYIVVRLLPWLVFALVVFALVLSTDLSVLISSESTPFSNQLGLGSITLLLGILTVIILKFAIVSLQVRHLRFEIREQRLIISRGYLFKRSGSLLLNRITDVYIGRTPLMFLFGICYLEILTPTEDSKCFARIEGLPRKSAERLQHHIFKAIAETPSDGRAPFDYSQAA